MSEPTLTAADRELELALSGLAPADTAIDRDQLMFNAGRASAAARSASTSLWVLRGVAASLAIGLGTSLLWRPAPRVVERVSYVRVDERADEKRARAAAPASRPASRAATEAHDWTRRATYSPHRPPLTFQSDADYLALRDVMLKWGVNALPAGGATREFGSTVPPTLDSLLDAPQAHPPAAPAGGLNLKRLFIGDSL